MTGSQRWAPWAAGVPFLIALAPALPPAVSAVSSPEPDESGSIELQEGPIPSPILEREEVRFVSLDLIAERKIRGSWQRVPGLREDQVHVYVGDTLVSFDMFEDHCEAPVALLATEAAAPAPRTPAPDGPRRFVLYFDLQHLKTPGIHSAFKAARTWAEDAFRPDDEVMIVTGSLGVRIVRRLLPASQGLEEDLHRAEEEYGRSNSWARGEGDDLTGRMREVHDAAALRTRTLGRDLATSYAAQDYHLTRRSLQNLRDLMAIFETVEGTKNLILFQETIRMFPGRQYPGAANLTDMEPFVRALAHAANERNVRVYPVDAGGMEGEGDEALHLMAMETGGRFHMRSNDLSPLLDWIGEDESCFYRLGFRVRPRFAGTVDRLRVELENPRVTRKYRLRHRRTLRDPTREQRDAERILGALMEPATADDFAVSVAASPILIHDGGGRVLLQVKVPFQALLAIPAGDPGDDLSQVFVQVAGSVVPLRETVDPDTAAERSVLFAAATDRTAWHFNRQALLQLSGDEADKPGAGRDLVVTREIDAPPGRYRLIAVVQDRLARELGAGAVDFEVAAEPPTLGAITLISQDPRIYSVKQKPDEAPAGEARKRGTITMATMSLPEGSGLRLRAELPRTLQGDLVYGVCDSDGGDPFDGWRMTRSLICDGEHVPTPASPTSLQPAGVGTSCTLVVDPLPLESLHAGACTYAATAHLPDGSVETSTLDFRVLP